jgi:hypothetical protein
MLMELGAAGLFGERVTDVAGGTNVAKDNLFVFGPSEDCKLFEFNMAGAAGRLLGICHESGAIVVLADDGGWQLFHSEFLESGAEVKSGFAGVGCGCKFCLGGGQCDGGLTPGFVKHCCSCEHKHDPRDGSTVLSVGSPV